MTTLAVPELSLVVLVGVTGSGKSTFARTHFKPTEVLSSDFCRGLVADDENDQSATNDAFEVLNFIAGKRLSTGRLTVVDATNVQPESRKSLVALARAHDVLPVAIVLDVPESVCIDVHGCGNELRTLLSTLGYDIALDDTGRAVDASCPGRRVVFVGDLVDRGPDTAGVLRLAMGMVNSGNAFCVVGNHEDKLVRALRGRNVKVSHGLAESLAQLEAETPEFRAAVEAFLDGLISHYVFDDGKLVVSHAGLVERMHGRASGRVRAFCLYGETTGETDEYGLPVRYPWANKYRGRAMVVYGHTPTPNAEWVNNTICIDTGCVFGGSLTALRYPERELVSVPADREYYAPAKPLVSAAQSREPDVLDITDVTGRRVIETGTHGRVSVGSDHAAAALEVMSRFAIDPRWLVYLPPTMSPVATAGAAGLLEHPAEAFEAYRAAGVDEVVCEEKHMGSRAVVLVCRDSALPAFGVEGSGAVWTRTGRSFFPDDMTSALVNRLRAAVEKAGLFDELEASWLLLDAELLPWSAKAGQLLRDQYAAVGAAARASLPVAVSALSSANEGLDGVRVAPFQLLASGGATYQDRPHAWHLELADRLVASDDGLVAPTRRLFVDLASAASMEDGVRWWEELTAAGGEGMVVKPAANLVRTGKGMAQPGLKVRGREYLRLIYGPDYTEPANLERLRQRNLGAKRSLALREYALGLEALDRLVSGEPLWRVHECVFAVLALESDPVDPRL
jgi:protein phosphatase